MIVPTLIVPTLRVGMNTVTLCVTEDAERPWLHSHAERGERSMLRQGTIG